MKSKVKFKTWNEIKGIMYPYRISLEGVDIRRAFLLSGLRFGQAFSDSELGFEKAYQRAEAVSTLKHWVK